MNRTYEYRRNLPHYQKFDRAHFVTFVTHERWVLPAEARDIVFNACRHFDGERLQLHAAVVMPEHVHLILGLLRNDLGEEFTFAETIGAIKGFTAHAINKTRGRQGSVWMDESFDHVLRCEDNLQDRIEYLRQNPVRRGLVSVPEEYRWLYVRKIAQPGTAAL
ncbi:MAG TPA: hypothetical protein VM056_05030, partial [Terriglobales bacterium]|nr:hypothetical protein [Terriglobales bacterium]